MIKSEYVFAALIIILFLGCKTGNQTSLLKLSQKYGGASSTRLDEYSLKEEVKHIFTIFNDSISTIDINGLWNYLQYKSDYETYSSSVPNIDNLVTFQRILNDKDINIAQVNDITFETLFALTRLPAIIYILSAHVDKHTYLNNKETSIKDLPQTIIQNLNLSIIKSIARENSDISYTTTGHMKIMGSPKDLLNGKISLTSNSKLIKSFDFYIVSKLSINEVKEYIEEWYKNLSYEYIKPEIIDLKQE